MTIQFGTQMIGRAYAPGSSLSRGARLHVGVDHAYLMDTSDKHLLTRCDRRDIAFDPPTASEAQVLRFPDRWLFQTQDPQIAALRPQPRRPRLLRRIGQARIWPVVWLLAGMLTFLKLGLWAWPLLSVPSG